MYFVKYIYVNKYTYHAESCEDRNLHILRLRHKIIYERGVILPPYTLQPEGEEKKKRGGGGGGILMIVFTGTIM